MALHAARFHLPHRYDLAPLQLGMNGEPWRVIVVSTLLNRTSNVTVRQVLPEVFNTWPDPTVMASANPHDLEHVIEACGLHRGKSRSLVKMSAAWYGEAWGDARDLAGVGPYVADAVGLFCFGCLEVESKDHVLVRYAREFDF